METYLEIVADQFFCAKIPLRTVADPVVRGVLGRAIETILAKQL
ncbi:MAG TPA: hypothetical protein VHD36_11890 [Pirellulales bacterium]|nr:hypothetical protein [Pirellulales bacterium]